MKPNKLLRMTALAAVLAGGSCLNPLVADVVILQNEAVITGNILQQDGTGYLIQTESGTWRYPLASIKEARKEASAAPHVSNNGQIIPDWAQIVTLLANSSWAEGVRQVPATVINYGAFNHVPYISFRCASGGYEVNIYGDLNMPAAVQVGAMGYLSDSQAARSNCVTFLCSVIASPSVRNAIRSLDLTEKQVTMIKGMTVQTILPGEMGSYGGWWVSVQNLDALDHAQASEAELNSLTQAPSSATTATASVMNDSVPVAAAPAQTPSSTPAAPPATAASQPVTTTTYTTYGVGYAYPYAWTQEEMANARPYAPPAAAPTAAAGQVQPNLSGVNGGVYPRSYNRADGTYARRGR